MHSHRVKEVVILTMLERSLLPQAAFREYSLFARLSCLAILIIPLGTVGYLVLIIFFFFFHKAEVPRKLPHHCFIPQPANYAKATGIDHSPLRMVAEKVYVITPTYPRAERLADMTRMAQALMLAQPRGDWLEWIVVEDGEATSSAIERLLQASGLPYHYLTAATPSKEKGVWSVTGNTQRNRGIEFLRSRRRRRLGAKSITHSLGGKAVVYFADDDNTYDYRLFSRYVRRLERRVGVWATGLAGGLAVVAPHIDQRTGLVTGWDGDYRRDFDDFMIDISGFAVDLHFLLRMK